MLILLIIKWISNKIKSKIFAKNELTRRKYNVKYPLENH